MADDQDQDQVNAASGPDAELPPRTSPSPLPDASPPPDDSIPQTRRIVDFDPEEQDWEDEDVHLDGLGLTTHRSRNRTVPVIPVRKHRRRVAGTNSRASAKARAVKAGVTLNFAADLAAWEVEREERAQQLADLHGMQLKEVRRRMLSQSAYAPKRKISLYNAKIARIMADVNADRELGDRYKMVDVKRLVTEDPSMLDAFTKEEEAELVAEAEAKRKTKFRGARANNLAAGADARRTIERLSKEITALADRAGMIGFAFFTRGHIHDKTAPVTIHSWGALDFCREILKKDPADISALFELWAVRRERGITGADTLLGMQQECTGYISSGLRTLLANASVRMSFEGYIQKLVERRNVGLVGWPDGVDFKRMSKQSAMGPLRILRDALKEGTCKWKLLTPGEKKQLVANFKEMVKRGEATEKSVKAPRASKRTETARKTTKASGASTRASRAKSKKTVVSDEEDGDEEDDDEEDDEEHAPRQSKAAPKASTARKSKAAPKPLTARKSKAMPAPATLTGASRSKPKRRVMSDDEDNEEDGVDDEERAMRPKSKGARKSSGRDANSDDDEEVDQSDPRHARAKAARKMFAQRKASSDSASDKGGNVPPCPKSKAAAKTSSGGTLSVRARLVALVEKAKRKKVNSADTVKAASKRRREEEGDGARKKRRKDGEEEDRGEEVAGGKTAGKRKRNGDEDEGSQRKKKKEKEKESNARPAKKGATDTEPNRPALTTGAAHATTTGAAPATTDAPGDGAGAASTDALPARKSPTEDAPPNGSSSGASASGGKRNTVRGKPGGPPGVR
ncbi:hypothetical protein DFH09DRAFT_1330788 [Mycena vulgaris]|nr:hypothetical protein DFH09DRAFT_1330788 [Mycena vulgaris]